MKIVIAGAGAVGTHLAQLLSKENHDIIVIDESSVNTESLSMGDLDILTLNVAPTSMAGLKEAGVQRADLFIAVTPEETKNLTCCMLAHTLGAKKTVARVDNSEYTLQQSRDIFHQMGIDSIIYPEELAAKEIVECLHRSWVRQYWEGHGGALVMLGIKMREGAKIYNTPLKELCKPETPYHIVAIKRDEDTIIPNGNTELRLGDIAYFMTTKNYIPTIRELVGKAHYEDVHNVMIMGGGDISVLVADRKPVHMGMKIIEKNEIRCQQLLELIDNDDIMIIQGDGRDTNLLVEEGINGVQAFAAITPDTENNILACLAAKRMGVRKTVAQVENMDYISLAEKLDIGTIINKKTIAASHIYQMMLDTDVASIRRLTIANADVAEFVATKESPITKYKIRDIHLPSGITLGGMVRDDVGLRISGDTQIKPGDHVVVFSKAGLIKKMDSFFAKPTTTLEKVKNLLS